MALLELEKLRKDINILFGYVRCLMAKSDENCPLVATEWSSNHSTVTGNPYTAGTYVFWNGHVYKCLFNNDGLPPTNTTYWLDLGEGHLLAEEQTDWNATGGRRYILNKPTKTSDFVNDGEDGSSPYVTQDELNNALPIQDLDSVLGEGDEAPTKGVYIEEIGFWDDFSAPFGYAKIYGDKAKIWFRSKLGNTMFSIGEAGWAFIKNPFTYNFNFPTLTNNRIATWQDKSGVVAYLSDIPVSPTKLDDLNDVTISSPLNGQIIRYNDTTFQWENVSVPIGPGDMQKTTYDTDNDGIVDKAEVVPVIVRNPSSVTLLKGQIVYLIGATGNRPNAFLAQANTEATSSGTFGVVTSDIASNSDGEIAMLGTLHNLATDGSSPFTSDTLVEGDLLWLSPTTAGFVTNIKPNSPNHAVFIGVVARVHPNFGRIVYRIQNGYELEELHNVSTLGRSMGETIMWNSVLNVWENKSIAGILGYTAADDNTFLYKKFMTNHFSYMLPGENSTYSLLRTNTTAGYLTTGTVATLSQMPMGLSYTSPSSPDSVAAVYGAPMRIQLSNSQDFTFQRKWKVQNNNTDQRYFVGITNKYLTAIPVNADQSLFLNTLGVVKLSTSDNWFFIYNDGSGIAGLIDCGSLFPATNAYTYSLKIQKVKGATSLTMTLTRIDSTGNTIEVSEVVNSTDYNTGVDYYPAIWASNNTATFNARFYDYGCMLLKSTI